MIECMDYLFHLHITSSFLPLFHRLLEEEPTMYNYLKITIINCNKKNHDFLHRQIYDLETRDGGIVK